MKINGLSTIIKVIAGKKKKIKKDKKEKAKENLEEDNSALCWPHYHVYEDEFIPITEEQAKMSEKEFREWMKSQGYYV